MRARARVLAALPPEQVAHQRLRRAHGMDEVAVPAARALALVVLPASGLAEIGHRGELAHDGPARVKATVELAKRHLCVLLAVELGVQVAGQVVAQVAGHVHLLHLSEIAQLGEDVLVELVEVLLCLLVVDLDALLQLNRFLVRVDVHVCRIGQIKQKYCEIDWVWRGGR